MTRIVYVEVFDERARLKERIRLDELPATIGRGYDSDVILDDPYVSPRHVIVRLDEQGTLVAEDLESLNGLHDLSSARDVARIEIGSGTRVRIGRTIVRFLDSAHPVAPTLAVAKSRRDMRFYPLSWRGNVAVTVAALALFTLVSFLGSYERGAIAQSVTTGLAIVAALTVWAGSWSLANRIVSHRFNFASHLGLAAGAAIVVVVFGSLTGWLDFLFPAADGFAAVDALMMMVVFGGLLYGHLSLVTTLAHGMLWRSAFAVTGAIAGLLVFSAYALDEPSAMNMPFSAMLKPLDSRLVRTISLDEFASEVAGLRRRANEAASEK